MRLSYSSLVLVIPLFFGCAAEMADSEDNPFDTLGTELTRSQEEARLTAVRDESIRQGLDNHWLLSSIAKCETQLAHCWSEATWACRGPASSSCGGGPVIAGSGDGACWRRQGGLGLFQFDAGNYDDTLRREGRGILTLDGNIDAAVRFTTDMVVRSRFVSGVSTREEALDWMNRIRPGSAGYDEWIDTVTGYYNGCMRGSCSIYASRSARYRRCHQEVLDIMGEDFFFAASDDGGTTPPPAPSCGDGTCDSGETCDACAADCGACPAMPSCGDGTCDSTESCDSCAADCGACPATPSCGDGTCDSTESCSSCAADCGACPTASCSVEGHMSTTDGGSCSTPEAWRCVQSPSLGSNVSQVCRDGRWLNFHVDPRSCEDCCGTYSTACRQAGS